MKATVKFMRSQRYLKTWFVFMWTVPIAEDGTKGERKKRYVWCHPANQFGRRILEQLDRAKMALRSTGWY